MGEVWGLALHLRDLDLCHPICYLTITLRVIQCKKPKLRSRLCCLKLYGNSLFSKLYCVLSGCRQSAQEAEEEARQQHNALEVARVACREKEEQLHRCTYVPRPVHVCCAVL